MNIRETLQEWQETQRAFDRARQEIHRRIIEDICCYVQRGRRFENTSIQELVTLHDEAQHRFHHEEDKAYYRVLCDIDSEFAVRGLDLGEFVAQLPMGELFAKVFKKGKGAAGSPG